MEWIYLSPHFDDAALSCGGLVWEQSQAGQAVHVWTVCAREPGEGHFSSFVETLHSRWGVGNGAAGSRREEDIRSCRAMGASYRHLPIPDCIYRGTAEPFYPSEESLFGGLHPAEDELVYVLSARLAQMIAPDAEVVCPLALGNHVDHQLTRLAAERLGRPLWYYADYPYVLKEPEALDRLANEGWKDLAFPVSGVGLEAWVAAVSAHASQLSTFWSGLAEMGAALREYCRSQTGVRLWRNPA